MSTPKKKIDVPIKDRYLLTYYEAAAYFGIGINRLREICKDPACSFVITTGEKNYGDTYKIGRVHRGTPLHIVLGEITCR